MFIVYRTNTERVKLSYVDKSKIELILALFMFGFYSLIRSVYVRKILILTFFSPLLNNTRC